MPPAQLPRLEEQSRFWDWHWRHSEERRTVNDWKDRRHEMVLGFLSSLDLDHPEILDLGCGPGWYTEKFAAFGQVTGVDLSDEAIAMAKERFPEVTFHVGNLYELPLPAEHYDVVISQEVIDHVADRVAFLDRAASLLKPEGYLILACGNKFVLDRLGEGVFPTQPPEHIAQFLTVQGWKRLLSSRYQVLRIRTLIMIGNRGILRLVNSPKLNAVLRLFLPGRSLEALKEWAGFGYVIVVLAQKKSRSGPIRADRF
jgi:2-polyprenyl-3-methyl-5-hydroxy-6-metoxy-1,4-benzoquinol methylase